MSAGRTDAHAADLAAALATRARRLAEEARDCAAGLERDEADLAEFHGPSPLAEQLSGAVRDRLGGIVADTRNLAATLERFGSLASSAPLPEEPEAGDSRVSEGVRSLATQMSVAGATREEIAVRLREDFGIADADAVAAEVLDDSWADS